MLKVAAPAHPAVVGFMEVHAGQWPQIKMNKRSRTDPVKSIVGTYLKRRHYTDSEVFRKSEVQLTQTHEQMAVLAAVEKETTRANMFIYSCTTYDMIQVDNQFTRFKTWVSELCEEMRCELSQLVCPLFSHLFLELVVSTPRQMASRFLKRHQPVLLMYQEADRDFLEELACVNTGQDMLMSQAVRAFRSCKYHVRLSSDVLILLQKYLTVQSHMQLLQVFDTWFDFEIMDVNSMKELDSDYGNMNGTIFELERTPKVEEDDKALIHIRAAIQTVHENQAPATKIHVHRIQNNNHNVYCAYRFDNTIALGWDNEVRLFQSPIKPGFNPASSVTLHNEPSMSEDSSFDFPDEWITLRGHCRAVEAIGMVGDNNYVTVSRDKTMRLWGDDAACLCIYRGHNYPIWCLDVGPLDAMIATGSRDRTACLWTVDRTYPVRILAGHTQDVECVQFHPNGQYLATGSTDHTVRMWSLTDAKMVRVFADHRASIQSLSFSPNGLYLATGGDDKRVRVWDLAESSVLLELKGHTGTIQSLAWSLNSELLASGALDGTVRIWDIRKPKEPSCLNDSTVYTTNCTSVVNVYFAWSNSVVALGTDT